MNENEDLDLKTLRMATTVSAIAFPAWGFIVGFFYPNAFDNLRTRIPSAIVFMLLSFCSHYTEYVRKRAGFFLVVGAIIGTFNLIFNQFQTNFHPFQQSVVVPTMIGLSTLTFSTSRQFFSYAIAVIVIVSSFFSISTWDVDKIVWLLNILFLLIAGHYFVKIKNKFIRTLQKSNNILAQANFRNEEWAELANQAAHDIRSPISALNVVKSHAGLNSEANQLFSTALDRVNEVANDLMSKSKGIILEPVDVELSSISVKLNELFNELRVQFPNVEYRFDDLTEGKVLKVPMPGSRLIRIIQNLTKNSSEAIDGRGAVSVSIAHKKGEVLIRVEDNGKGMDKELTNKIGQLGFTANKPDGTGFGLHYSIKMIESFGGTFNIKSSKARGTHITIALPL
jgi:signal transduction histidine kinase